MGRMMKDSGIEWIGQIPEGWEIRKLKCIASIIRGGSPRPIEVFLTDSIDGYNWIKIGDTIKGNKYINSTKQRIIPEGAKKSRMVHKGDLLLTNSMSFGEPYILNIDGCIHDGWVSFTEYKDINTEYLYYFLSSEFCLIQFRKQVDGGVVQNLNIDKIGTTLIHVPPLSEQKRIADFLDLKCAEIDSVIGNTEATIDEYKKLKQSIITEAVTKGIRGNRPMKDSGIEWIGEIPEEWDIKVAFQLFNQVKCKNEGLIEKNLLSLSYGKIKRKSIDTIGGLLPESFDGYNIIERNDIVLRLTDLQNDHTSLRVGLSTERGIVTSAYLTLRNQSKNLPLYLYYYLHTFDVCKGFYGMGAGVRQGLNWDGLKLLKIATPPVCEQVEITNYLESQMSEINKLIDAKQKLLEELQAYKKSLIYEYVTGKKEVQ